MADDASKPDPLRSITVPAERRLIKAFEGQDQQFALPLVLRAGFDFSWTVLIIVIAGGQFALFGKSRPHRGGQIQGTGVEPLLTVLVLSLAAVVVVAVIAQFAIIVYHAVKETTLLEIDGDGFTDWRTIGTKVLWADVERVEPLKSKTTVVSCKLWLRRPITHRQPFRLSLLPWVDLFNQTPTWTIKLSFNNLDVPRDDVKRVVTELIDQGKRSREG